MATIVARRRFCATCMCRDDIYQCDSYFKGETMAMINVGQLVDNVLSRFRRRASLNNRSLEGEAHHSLECASDDGMVAKRAAFREAMNRLRPLTEGRKHTPAEALIRRGRDHGHRDNL